MKDKKQHVILQSLNLHRYFLMNDKGEKMKGQLGVVRTNCIDCLDRTNVTQVCLNNIMMLLLSYFIGLLVIHAAYFLLSAEHDRSKDARISTQKDWCFWR